MKPSVEKLAVRFSVQYGKFIKIESIQEKDLYMEIPGVIKQAVGNGYFLVDLDNGMSINAHVSGKMKRNFIKISLGDHVKTEMSLYDLKKGRIIYRFRNGRDRLIWWQRKKKQMEREMGVC